MHFEGFKARRILTDLIAGLSQNFVHLAQDVQARLQRLIQCLLHNLFREDRKSTRLNSSHVAISYAVFCLKKKNTRGRTSLTPTIPTKRRARPHTAEEGPYTHT